MSRGDFPGSNFVGRNHENGFGLQFQMQPDGSVLGETTFDPSKQGPPNLTHGGAMAAVLDEAMTAVVFLSDMPALTATLDIAYRAPVPIGTHVTVTGRIDRVIGRKIHTSAAILLPDGNPAAEARALFIAMRRPDENTGSAGEES